MKTHPWLTINEVATIRAGKELIIVSKKMVIYINVDNEAKNLYCPMKQLKGHMEPRTEALRRSQVMQHMHRRALSTQRG